MGRIFGSVVIASIGMLLVSANTPLPQFPQNRQLVLIGLGGLLQFGALFVFLSGCKQYFFAEIIGELKKLSSKG